MAGYEMENHDMRAAALARQEAEAEAEQRGVEPGHMASPQVSHIQIQCVQMILCI